MSVVFEQVSILIIFALTGFVLSKANVIKREYAGLLSGLCVYVFLPCSAFKTFATGFNLQYLQEKSYFVLVSIGTLLVLAPLSHFLAKLFAKGKYERSVYEYSLTIPNYGYMGYVLVESLYGSAGLLDFMMFTLPTGIYVHTLGYAMLTKRKMNPKLLLQPVIIAMLLGCVVGLLGLEMPGTVTQILDRSAACVGPISMILAGITISEFKLKEILGKGSVYIVTVLRLLVIPCAVAGALKVIGLEQAIVPTLMTYAMPCGLNTIVFPKLVGEDCKIGAGLACVSSILACVTIPICAALFL